MIFAGIGNSEGDFADTNFTTSVEDIIHVAKHMRDNYDAPSIIVGHSFGGAWY